MEPLPPGVEPPVPPQVNAQAGDQQQRQQAHYQQQYGARQQMPPYFYPGGWGPWGMAPPPPPTHQIKLPQIWCKDIVAWFTLVESTFNRYRVEDSRMRFDLTLPALSEDALERVRAVLHMAPAAADPYLELKRRLVEVYTPSVLDLAYRILYAPELGGRRPSELMETMLASLPPGEPPGILFKAHFLTRLPTDIRDLVAVNIAVSGPLQLAALADQFWLARNSRPAAVAAAVSPADDLEDLEDTVAALSFNKSGGKARKRGGKKKKEGDSSSGGGKAAHGGGGSQQQQSPPYLCRFHLKYREQAHSCADPKFCGWSGN